MQGLAPDAVLDLVAAARAVGDQHRARRIANRRQQRHLRHLHRYFGVLRLVAEAAGHAAAARFHGAHLQARHHGERLLHRAHAVEGLLVAVAMQQHLLLQLVERELPRTLRNPLLEEERILRQRNGTGNQHRQLIAQRVEARWFQAEDRQAASDRGAQTFQQAPGLTLRALEHADRKIGASAAQPGGNLHAVAGGLEYHLGRARVLRLEVAIEGVDEQHDIALRGAGVAKVIAPPARQRPPGKTDGALERARGEIGKRREARRDGRIARQEGDRPIAGAVTMARLVVGEELDLHTRHVDAGRAFALAAFARDAEIERLLYRRVTFSAELAGQREAQRVRAAAREMDLVARRAIRRAHRAGVELAAMTVVVAHLDGLVEAAPFAPVENRRRHVRSIVRLVSKERGIVHLRRLDDLPRIHQTARVEP